MNKIAAAKAVGTYLLIMGSLVAWIGGAIWAGVTDQPGLVQLGLGVAPLWLTVAGMIVYGIIIRPIVSMYRSYDEAARR